MPAPVYVDNGGIAFSDSTVVSPAYPVVQAGDILFLQYATRYNSTFYGLDGWQLAGLCSPLTGIRSCLYWKRSDGTESGVFNLTRSDSEPTFAIISCWRGCVAEGTPFEGVSRSKGRGSLVSSLITPTVENTRVTCFIAVLDNTYVPPLSGGNYINDFTAESTENADCEFAASSFAMSTPIEEPARSGTIGYDYWVAFTLALLPLPAPPSAPQDIPSLTSVNFGKHTKWSRYRSQGVPLYIGDFTYEIDSNLWPSPISNNVRILSINCLRFPHSAFSLKILANLIMSSNADIVLVQEITTISHLRECCLYINEFLGSSIYSLLEGDSYINNLQLCIFYKQTSWTLISKQTLKINDPDVFWPMNRLPFNVIFSGTSFDIDITNIHLPSVNYTDWLARRNSSFENLANYFGDLPCTVLTILGGDFNSSFPSSIYNDLLSDFITSYDIYTSNSDVILFHENNLVDIVQAGYSQYLWDFITYCDLTPDEYATFFSDHSPVILDLPL